MRFAVLGIFVIAAMLLLAGCAQKPPGNATNQTPPGSVTPPLTPPAPVPQAPPVAPPSNQTQGNASADDDMFGEDLGEALDDLDAVTDPSGLEQTSPNTYCDSDEDCWCRIFDGARFLPGKTGWSCDTQAKRCQKCIYK